MTSQRLSQRPVSVARFDAIGEDSHTAPWPNFVRHVGLAFRPANNVTAGTQVDVVHMCPPFENPGSTAAHVVGSVPLSSDQENRLEMFLDNADGEFKALRKRVSHKHWYCYLSFVVRPHVKAEPQDNPEYHRYSCVGFVIEAYRSAGLGVIETDEARLPPVSRQTLQEAFELCDVVFDDSALASWLGLDRNERERWPVVLPSYVFHALNRPEVEIKRGYPVKPEDDTFPSRPPA